MSKTITQIELARLAAMLAKDGDDATRLTRRAFELWEASGKELVHQKARATLRAQGQREQDSVRVPPWPKTLERTMTLDEFLRLLLPSLPLGKDEGERVKRYRHFLASRCKDAGEERQLNYAESEIKQAKAVGFNTSTYHSEARAFLSWEAFRAKEARSARARKGAEGLKAKRAAEKEAGGA